MSCARGSKGQIYIKLSIHAFKFCHLGWTPDLKLDFLVKNVMPS